MKSGIKVSVMYQNGDGKTFDMDYYNNKHIPMVQERMGGALKETTVEKGLAGGAPGSVAPYLGIGNMYFDSLEDFQNAFGPHAEEIMGDIPNYTNSEPVIQISEVIR